MQIFKRIVISTAIGLGACLVGCIDVTNATVRQYAADNNHRSQIFKDAEQDTREHVRDLLSKNQRQKWYGKYYNGCGDANERYNKKPHVIGKYNHQISLWPLSLVPDPFKNESYSKIAQAMKSFPYDNVRTCGNLLIINKAHESNLVF